MPGFTALLQRECSLSAEPRDKVKVREFCPGEAGTWLGLNRSACVLQETLSNHSTVCFD